jgi:signal transduction histidine kinase
VAETVVLVVGLAVCLAAGPVWWLVGLLRRERRRLRELAGRLGAMVATSPAPACGWRVGSEAEAPVIAAADFAATLGVDRIAQPQDIARALAPADSATFLTAFGDLCQDGRSFRIQAMAGDVVRRFVLSGHRHDGFNVVWLEDGAALAAERMRSSAALAALRAADHHRDIFQAVLDVLPVPLWLRREDLAISWCNQAYATALDSTPETVIRAGGELGGGKTLAQRARTTGKAQTETRRVVIGSDRHVIEVTEALLGPSSGARPGAAPAATGLIIGFAIDRTREEALRADLARHVSAHAAVLEQLGSAIAVYGADRRLSFYNQAYVRLWGLDEGWLATLPSFGEVLEELRTRRRLPEYADFPQFKKENLALFTELIEPRETLMHLPDGTTVRVLIVPHSFGGLMFVLEDVTNTLALESSYNILMAVQQETLDNLAEGIAVFGGDGRLKLSNPAYATMWGLGSADLAGEPHITDLLEQVRTLMDRGEDWPALKEQMVAATLERTTRNGRLERTDGSMLDFAYVPLPDGAVLTTYLDVTDSVRVEQALRARNAALAEADRLKTEFLANVSYHLRTPLNSIMGFAEMLANEYFGQLNERQMQYSRNVLTAGASLLAMINDILDLATIEAGYMTLERRPVEVLALLTGVASLAQEWTAKQSMRLELDCPNDIGEIDADEKRLKQALFNLISNAIRCSPAGGTITLSARRRQETVVLTVRDGAAATAASRASDGVAPLERFEPPRPFGSGTREDGSGLGLTLVKSFIELHGGQIGIESAVGQGTSIHCILPIRPLPTAAPSPVSPL